MIAEQDSNQSRYRSLVKTYRHYSPNSPEFELTCIRRYFILLDYVSQHKIESFVLIDSDLLLFQGVTEHVRRVADGSDFTGSQITATLHYERQISPHISYWTRSALDEFVSFIVDFYEPRLGHFDATRARLKVSNPELGISDMTLLFEWASGRGLPSPINSIRDGAVVDHNVNMKFNLGETIFRTRFGQKKILYKQNGPHFETEDGLIVRALAIHCQGKAKLNMGNILAGNRVRSAVTAATIFGGRRLKNLLK